MNCNGCTKCCEAIMIHKRAWELRGKGKLGDPGFIFSNWKRISLRRAKKRNPHLLDTKYHGKQKVQRMKRNQIFFKCRNLTDSGCAVYDERPQVCSGYPHYGGTPKAADEYNPDCVYHLALG